MCRGGRALALLAFFVVSTTAARDVWHFQANWSFPQPIHSTTVKPGLQCPYAALSVLHTAHTRETRVMDATEMDALREFLCEPWPTTNSTECRVSLSWHLRCVYPCQPFCAPPLVLNQSWVWTCHPRLQYCQLQRRRSHLSGWMVAYLRDARRLLHQSTSQWPEWAAQPDFSHPVVKFALACLTALAIVSCSSHVYQYPPFWEETGLPENLVEKPTAQPPHDYDDTESQDSGDGDDDDASPVRVSTGRRLLLAR